MSDELGSIIKEANPPSTIGKISNLVELKSVSMNSKAKKKIESNNQNYFKVKEEMCKK